MISMGFTRILLLTLVLMLFSFHAIAQSDLPVHESNIYPIRVFCEDEGLAADALAEAEAAWEEQIITMGFELPLALRDDAIVEGYDLIVGSDPEINAIAAFNILGDNPSTPRSDCPTIGYLASGYMSYAGYLPMGVRHLLNHGSQHAIDCLEPQQPAFDMITVAIVLLTLDEHPLWTQYYLPTFQSLPEKSLDYVPIADMSHAYYMFGAALFSLFLEEVYGNSDGTLLARIWERTEQDGTINWWQGEFCRGDVDNEPDFFDAISAELETIGSSFDEAFMGFVEWRFFIGEDDDGAHFENGATWTGCEITRQAVLSADDLPIIDRNGRNAIAEFAAAYIELDLTGIEAGRTFSVSLSGNEESRWAATALVQPPSGSAERYPLLFTDDVNGEVLIDEVRQGGRLVVAIANLGDGDHDPDIRDHSAFNGDFSYSIEVIDPSPEPEPEPDGGILPNEDAGADGGVADATPETGTRPTEPSSGCIAGNHSFRSSAFLSLIAGIVRL